MNTPGHDRGVELPDHPRRILVADDDRDAAAELTSQLDMIGSVVVGPVGDGESAVELCEVAAPDLAILDIRMPRQDGLEAASEIFRHQRVPVIILSAFSHPDQVIGAVKAGVFGYLIKPSTCDQLRAAINVAWHRFLDWVAQNHENEELRQRLEDRKDIEKAKWWLVQGRNMTEPDAMRLLVQRARTSRTRLVEVARAMIESGGVADGR